jgi:hypothetical protein
VAAGNATGSVKSAPPAIPDGGTPFRRRQGSGRPLVVFLLIGISEVYIDGAPTRAKRTFTDPLTAAFRRHPPCPLQARRGHGDAPTWILDQAFGPERAAPMVTVLDGHPHTLAFLSTINHVRSASLGVSKFGQARSLEDVYHYHAIDTDAVVRAALDRTLNAAHGCEWAVVALTPPLRILGVAAVRHGCGT